MYHCTVIHLVQLHRGEYEDSKSLNGLDIGLLLKKSWAKIESERKHNFYRKAYFPCAHVQENSNSLYIS